MVDRRRFLKSSIAAGVAAGLPMGWVVRDAAAAEACAASVLDCGTLGLSDPAMQFDMAGFMNPVPDAMAPSFIYQPDKQGHYKIGIGTSTQQTGLVDAANNKLQTPVWGYGDRQDRIYTWPGRTFQIHRNAGETEVSWANSMKKVFSHLLPVDTNLHWCYSLPGYTDHSIAANGVPIITHLHGGHSDFQFDGNPEFFYGPPLGNRQVVGPSWALAPKGFTEKFRYDNNVPAGTLWYHDHALGITRLNVYAGLAGFYIVRDDFDTGSPGNAAGLPAWPYEKLYAIQDRMFLNTGELFYPSLPGDPFYADFIDGEGAELPPGLFPGGGPTALAEFFGDHMVVNGVIWPREDVEPRNYRMRLLNGTDSRFMALQFYAVNPGKKTLDGAEGPLEFTVIGSDQGLASAPETGVTMLVSEPGSRYDVIFDFARYDGKRIIMKNIGGDEPFGGDVGVGQLFEHTDKVMAFDVNWPLDMSVADVSPTGGSGFSGPPDWESGDVDRVRKVALFEGTDEFGRLQPLLGTAEPASDHNENPIYWPNGPLAGQQMEGSIAWHSPTTENPALGDVEEWEIWNMTGDAHPVHLHLVNFRTVDREEIRYDSNADEDGFIPEGDTPAGDGAYLVPQPVLQHNGEIGNGFRIGGVAQGYSGTSADLGPADGYVENTPKDMVTALPGQITRIRAKFDKPGRYVWHCHILSHEDHEMMRVLHVGPGA